MLQPRPPLPFLLLSAYPLFSRGISCLLDRKNMMGSSDAQYFPSNFETNWGEKNCKCNGKKKTNFRARRETKKTFFFSKTVLLSSRVFFFCKSRVELFCFCQEKGKSREKQLKRKANQERKVTQEKGNSRERQIKRKANQEKSGKQNRKRGSSGEKFRGGRESKSPPSPLSRNRLFPKFFIQRLWLVLG